MDRKHRRWYAAAAFLLIVPSLWAALRLGVDVSTHGDPFAFYGVRLGISAADLRDRYELPGEWSLSTDEAGGLELGWLPEAPGSVKSARFQFHEGLLVAIRARLASQDAFAGADGIVVTADAIMHRVSGEDGFSQMSVISRNCPTHADEVAHLMELE